MKISTGYKLYTYQEFVTRWSGRVDSVQSPAGISAFRNLVAILSFIRSAVHVDT